MLLFYLSMLETAEDQEKFTKLYEAWERKLYAVALHILKDSTRAEDALQQCWLNLIQHWDSVACLDWLQAGAYAVTTVKHTALNLLQKEKRTVALPETWDPPAPGIAGTLPLCFGTKVHF